MNGETDVEFRKGHPVYPGRILLIGGTGIQSQHANERLSAVFRHKGEKPGREIHLQLRSRLLLRKAADRIGMCIGIANLALDVVVRCAVH